MPLQELEWLGQGGGFSGWGHTKDGFFGISVRPEILDTWKWSGAGVEKELAVELPDLLDVVVLPDNRYLACMSPGDAYTPWPLIIGSLGARGVIKKWEPPTGWGFHGAGVSRNRKFAALTLEEDYSNPPEDCEWDNPRLRVGLVDISALKIRWVAELRGGGRHTIRRIAVSDDGRYIAIGGWKNRVALVDASLRNVLWVERPAGANSLGYVVFSSNGLLLYAGDPAGGCVYALETKTGKVTGRWFATETGEAIYGHRISCLAISPDDSWVAAGTGPEGQVYLFHVTTDEKPRLLPHGLITTLIVSFSPDSRHLASVGGGRIKVWRVR